MDKVQITELPIGTLTTTYKAFLETLMEEAIKTAKKIAKNAPIAVAYSKKVINKGLSMDMVQSVELESQAFAALFGTKDQKEGMAAFMEKRKADFKGE